MENKSTCLMLRNIHLKDDSCCVSELPTSVFGHSMDKSRNFYEAQDLGCLQMAHGSRKCYNFPQIQLSMDEACRFLDLKDGSEARYGGNSSEMLKFHGWFRGWK